MSGIVGWCSGRIGYKKSHSHNQPKRGPALLFETDPQGPIRRISLKNRRVLENSTFLVAPSGTKPRRGQEKVRDSCQIHSAMPMMSRGILPRETEVEGLVGQTIKGYELRERIDARIAKQQYEVRLRA